MNEISHLDFYKAFCNIIIVIDSQFKHNINSVLYDKSKKSESIENVEPKSGIIHFDTIEKFLMLLLKDNNDDIKYEVIISLYFNIIKKIVSTSYGYMALKRYNMLDNLLNLHKEEKNEDKKLIYLKYIIDYLSSTRGLYDLIIVNHNIENSINQYINQPNLNIHYMLNLFNGIIDTGLMKNIYDPQIIKYLVNILHNDIYNKSNILLFNIVIFIIINYYHLFILISLK